MSQGEKEIYNIYCTLVYFSTVTKFDNYNFRQIPKNSVENYHGSQYICFLYNHIKQHWNYFWWDSLKTTLEVAILRKITNFSRYDRESEWNILSLRKLRKYLCSYGLHSPNIGFFFVENYGGAENYRKFFPKFCLSKIDIGCRKMKKGTVSKGKISSKWKYFFYR